LADLLLLSLVYWTLRGMEVGLVTALALAAVLLALRLAQRPRSLDLVGLATVIAAGIWTRLDFAAFVPAILAFHAGAWRPACVDAFLP